MARPLSRRALWMQKLADEVVAGVAERIRNGDLKIGMTLGTRDDLAGDFVTSAGVVDRAIETLTETGVVAEGEGGVLTVTGYPGSDQGFALPTSAEARLPDVIAILELRIGVEVEAAALCAARRSAEDLETIRAAARAYEEAGAARSGMGRADFLFHRAIAAATGNSYILELLDYLGPLLIPRMRVPIPEKDGDGHLQHSIAEHAAIVAAIAAGEPDAAQEAMRAHLERAIALMRELAARDCGKD